MKQTVNVNIGSQAFILDEDAHAALERYFDDIRGRLSEEQEETMGDIEVRIGEIFREKVVSPMRVVTLDTVRAAMAQMGSPADFGECCNNTEASQPIEATSRKLYRSRTNRAIAGICGGLSEFFRTDPTLFRIVSLLLIFFGGVSIWVYIILWIVIPEESAPKFSINNKNR